jgi:hypothetical protein
MRSQAQKDYAKQYYLLNRQRILDEQKEYQSTNKEARKKYREQWDIKNRAIVKAKKQQYYLEHKEDFFRRAKSYRANNVERVRVIRRIYESNKRKNDINYKIAHNLRRRLRQTISNKTMGILSILGCSLDEFRTHLESMFLAGMTWTNYGDWHIDHVKPCVLFDLSSPDEQAKCFHYSNLQPLWAVDNLKKGSKY